MNRRRLAQNLNCTHQGHTPQPIHCSIHPTHHNWPSLLVYLPTPVLEALPRLAQTWKLPFYPSVVIGKDPVWVASKLPGKLNNMQRQHTVCANVVNVTSTVAYCLD
jgi:hypothetical protein